MRDWMGARPADCPHLRLTGNGAGRTSGRPAGLPHGPHKDARRAGRRPHPAPQDLPGADRAAAGRGTCTPLAIVPNAEGMPAGATDFGAACRDSAARIAGAAIASPACAPRPGRARFAARVAMRTRAWRTCPCVARCPCAAAGGGGGRRPRMASRSAVRRDRAATSRAGLRAAWQGASGAGRTGCGMGMHGAGCGGGGRARHGRLAAHRGRSAAGTGRQGCLADLPRRSFLPAAPGPDAGLPRILAVLCDRHLKYARIAPAGNPQ